ncbi:hypothetical protein FisN_3Lh293 [Fistulifera solaris]|uniref:carbonic anhydrase n=1 Tax=Fistulifera solaris TaxID=1519565 RepID=A0A1Z5J7Y5_FISSO|nr:hypothetical protein FisN_3Lh293 [Fistulifera solaris]|eukprot:GAX10104.1 hypothetical protein FisN_3Lh293 [Fistulifera solaris]
MKFSGFILSLLTLQIVQGNNSDLFNYGSVDINENGVMSYGQENWGDVSCSDFESCPGFPNKYPVFPGYEMLKTKDTSQCRYCPQDESVNCGLHRQSPIDLKRDRGVAGSPNEKFCPDWHWMEYRPDTCTWDDMKTQLTIERHALQIHVPQLPNGDIDCFRWDKRRYPRIDYSKGFPDWWWMQRTDIHVPSNHIQEGTRYAAEVVLAHFYEIKHEKNQLGYISIFMQDYPDAESWSYLDKLICQWRKEEDRVREACGLPPVEPYGRCALLRNQQPTQEWLDEAAGLIFAPGSNNTSSEPPIVPDDEPTYNESGAVDSLVPSPAPSFPTGLREPNFGQAGSIFAPSAQPSVASEFGASEVNNTIPPPIDCLNLGDVIDRMCLSEDPCCTSPRTNTVFCDNIYDNIFPGDAMKSACYHCCPTPLTVGDAELTASSGSDMPSDIPTTAPGSVLVPGAIPPPIDCGSDNTLIERMCSSNDPCCGAPRSDTMFCWNIYDNVFPGEQIKSACYHCCSEPKMVAEERPINPAIPKTIECSAVDNPYRMCKENSCCSNPRSNSEFCKSVYAKHKGDIESICQYCCREPLTVGSARYLRSGGEDEAEFSEDGPLVQDSDDIQEGDEVVYVSGKKYILRKDNFEEDEENGAKHFQQRIQAEFQERNLNVAVHDEDYDDIPWFAYEWMVKVGTEYYYRYEGTQLVPPCWEVVHWRVMKDPIRVHKRQIDELNRLLAWRLNPDTCQSDTAGVVSDDGNTVDLSREVMYYHDQHRKVFCECPAWPSQFPGDQEWCRHYRDDTNYDRFYTRPYSFDSGGKWHPNDV